jgi:hypothetical protein
MKSRHEGQNGVTFQVGDVRDMKDIETGSIDVAFDKGTLDAMIFGSPWSPPEETLGNSGKYMKEVSTPASSFRGSASLTGPGPTSFETGRILPVYYLPTTSFHQAHLEPGR